MQRPEQFQNKTRPRPCLPLPQTNCHHCDVHAAIQADVSCPHVPLCTHESVLCHIPVHLSFKKDTKWSMKSALGRSTEHSSLVWQRGKQNIGLEMSSRKGGPCNLPLGIFRGDGCAGVLELTLMPIGPGAIFKLIVQNAPECFHALEPPRAPPLSASLSLAGHTLYVWYSHILLADLAS